VAVTSSGRGIIAVIDGSRVNGITTRVVVPD
jgi:adenosine/AMP kinase